VGLSTIGLINCIVRFGEPEEEGAIPDWDEDFHISYFVYIFIGVGAIILISVVILSWGQVFYFMSWNELEQLGTVQQLSLLPTSSADYVARIFQEAIWQIFIVAYSEETLKLAVILPFMYALRDYQYIDVIVGAGVPILLWAEFHTMLAYGMNTTMVVAAFLAGVVLFALLKATGSVLVPILIHAFYNLIVVMPTIGVNITSVLPSATNALLKLLNLVLSSGVRLF
jgi:membrane protease YdiL (CAAX protease family)